MTPSPAIDQSVWGLRRRKILDILGSVCDKRRTRCGRGRCWLDARSGDEGCHIWQEDLTTAQTVSHNAYKPPNGPMTTLLRGLSEDLVTMRT
eukprot:CAMPEP_0118941904 /NCGR_PEP_ID=MMETSP1169-20130426/34937_1 /TAXON_ID=36882 /ORGANISM="Pyramimonas obovata, Strain CCMP722" /LENGTH=91 /DNA_ID=CAMNT_0006886789 /DNA_START=34 /DNA_END=307 /DNA_ORIENTATION=-